MAKRRPTSRAGHASGSAANDKLQIALATPRPPLYLDLRAYLPNHPTYLSHFRDCLSADDRRDLNRITEFACRLFNRSTFTEDIFDRFDAWLELQCAPKTDLYGLSLTSVADLLEAAVCNPGLSRVANHHKTKKSTRTGRPRDSDPKADKRLCEAWKAAKRAGTNREEFARERGITVQALVDAQHREKYRRQRDAE